MDDLTPAEVGERYLDDPSTALALGPGTPRDTWALVYSLAAARNDYTTMEHLTSGRLPVEPPISAEDGWADILRRTR